jgi:hypothetical protein
MARLMEEEAKLAAQNKPADRGRPTATIMLDTGNFSESGNEVKRIETEAILEIMETLGYASVGLGFKELHQSQEELYGLVEGSGLPLTCADLSFEPPQTQEDYSGELNSLLEPYRVHELDNGYRVGIIHVIDQTYVRKLNPAAGARVGEAAKAIQEVLDGHGNEADYWVVTVAEGVSGSHRAAEIYNIGGLDLVVGFERFDEENVEAVEGVQHAAFVDPPYHKSRDIVRIEQGFSNENEQLPVVADKLQLQESIKPSPEVLAILEATQPKLEAEANRKAEEAAKHSGPHPWYAGASTCATCHSDISLMLQETQHIHAYETLVADDEHKSAACLPCHVVGYEHPDRGGFNIFDKEPETLGVRCENCHGPGEYHVAIMSGEPAPPDLQEDGRNEFGLVPVTAGPETCTGCHDELNSVGFDFDVYWPRIQHGKGRTPDLSDTSNLGGMKGAGH